MDILFINSENSKTSDSYRLILSLTDIMKLNRSDRYVAFSILKCKSEKCKRVIQKQ